MTAAPKPLLPVFIGVALTVVLLGVLGYLAQLRRNAEPAPPALTILSPGATPADSPFTIRFESSQRLHLGTSGWASGQWHLHARVNGIEYMPAAAEVSDSGSIYRWEIPAIGRGRLSYSLGWADRAHRPVVHGRTPAIETVLR
jgi:hypothetical protein